MRKPSISIRCVTGRFAPGAARTGGDAARGEKLYEDCAACHSIERGVNGVGPTLYGIFGRKAGELDDYRYSPALKRSGIIWKHVHRRFTGDGARQSHAVCRHAERGRPRRSDRLPAEGVEVTGFRSQWSTINRLLEILTSGN